MTSVAALRRGAAALPCDWLSGTVAYANGRSKRRDAHASAGGDDHHGCWAARPGKLGAGRRKALRGEDEPARRDDQGPGPAKRRERAVAGIPERSERHIGPGLCPAVGSLDRDQRHQRGPVRTQSPRDPGALPRQAPQDRPHVHGFQESPAGRCGSRPATPGGRACAALGSRLERRPGGLVALPLGDRSQAGRLEGQVDPCEHRAPAADHGCARHLSVASGVARASPRSRRHVCPERGRAAGTAVRAQRQARDLPRRGRALLDGGEVEGLRRPVRGRLRDRQRGSVSGHRDVLRSGDHGAAATGARLAVSRSEQQRGHLDALRRARHRRKGSGRIGTHCRGAARGHERRRLLDRVRAVPYGNRQGRRGAEGRHGHPLRALRGRRCGGHELDLGGRRPAARAGGAAGTRQQRQLQLRPQPGAVDGRDHGLLRDLAHGDHRQRQHDRSRRREAVRGGSRRLSGPDPRRQHARRRLRFRKRRYLLDELVRRQHRGGADAAHARIHPTRRPGIRRGPAACDRPGGRDTAARQSGRQPLQGTAGRGQGDQPARRQLGGVPGKPRRAHRPLVRARRQELPDQRLGGLERLLAGGGDHRGTAREEAAGSALGRALPRPAVALRRRPQRRRLGARRRIRGGEPAAASCGPHDQPDHARADAVPHAAGLAGDVQLHGANHDLRVHQPVDQRPAVLAVRSDADLAVLLGRTELRDRHPLPLLRWREVGGLVGSQGHGGARQSAGGEAGAAERGHEEGLRSVPRTAPGRGRPGGQRQRGRPHAHRALWNPDAGGSEDQPQRRGGNGRSSGREGAQRTAGTVREVSLHVLVLEQALGVRRPLRHRSGSC